MCGQPLLIWRFLLVEFDAAALGDQWFSAVN
jgi:hypothetical protein